MTKSPSRLRLLAALAVVVALPAIIGGTWAGLTGTTQTIDNRWASITILPPQNTTPPQITAGPGVDTAQADPGTWDGDPTGFTFQWQRCNATGSSCQNIPGATTATYTLAGLDDIVAARFRVQVTASNAAGPTTASSAPTVRPSITATTPPALTGTPTAGQTLTLTSGTWAIDDTPSAVTYLRWERCDTNGENCVARQPSTPGVYTTDPALALTSEDTGHRIRVIALRVAPTGQGIRYAEQVANELSATIGLAPVNTGPPEVRDSQDAQITGSPFVTDTLRASTGTWANQPTNYTYQWQRCDTAGSSCAQIDGATSQNYQLASSDYGHRIRVEITASNAYGQTSEISPPTAIVAVRDPINTDPPTISGSTVVGGTLSATTGTWLGANLTYAYQWQRCDNAGANCTTIAGATGSSYTTTQTDAGARLRVRVIATQGDRSSQATSTPTAAITAPLTMTVAPSIGGNNTREDGQPTLSANAGGWVAGAAIILGQRWQSCDANGMSCTDISGATSPTFTPSASTQAIRLKVTASTTAGESQTAYSDVTVLRDDAIAPILGVNGTVWSITGDGSQGAVAGGEFTTVDLRRDGAILSLSGDGRTTSGSIRLNSGGAVTAAVTDSDGNTYIAGSFTTVNGQPRQGLARVTANGAVSSWAPTVNGGIRTLRLDGSRLLLGGYFTTVNGQSQPRLAAVTTTNGELDSTLTPQIDGTYVSAIAVANGRVYVSGSFTTINGQARTRFAAFDRTTGALQAWAPTGTAGGGDSAINGIVPAGSKIYLLGGWAQINGVANQCGARVDATTGALDTTWSAGCNGGVMDVATDGTTAWIVGWFTTFRGASKSGIAAFDLATGNLTGFTANISASGNVSHITQAGANVIVAGGTWTSINGTSKTRIAKLNATTGALDTTWDPAPDAEVGAVAATTSAVTALTAGALQTIAPQPRTRLMRVNRGNGLKDWSPAANDTVYTVESAANGDEVYVGGAFTTLAGQTARRVGTVNVTTGARNPNAMVQQGPSNGVVYSILPVGQRVYIGGNFGGATVTDPACSSSCQTTTRSSLYAVNGVSSSPQVTRWAPNPNNLVFQIKRASDRLVIGGDFTTIAGVSRGGGATFDLGASDDAPPVQSFNAQASSVRCMVPSAGQQRLYLGGGFTSAGGATRNGIAAFEGDGYGTLASWYPVITPSGWINRCHASDNVLITDSNTQTAVDGVPQNYVAAFNMATGARSTWNPKINGEAWGMYRPSGAAKMWLGGPFTSAEGRTAIRFAQVAAPADIPDVTPPVSTDLPTVSGNMTIGSQLTANPGSWSDSPTFTYQWQRTVTIAGDSTWTNISGATSATYTLTPSDIGSTLRVRVAASNPDGSSRAYSAATAMVSANVDAFRSEVAADAPWANWRHDTQPVAADCGLSAAACAPDSSGNTRHGSVFSSLADQDGIATGAKALRNMRYYRTQIPTTGTGRTIEMWINPDSTSGGGNQALLSIGDQSGGYGLYLTNSSINGLGSCLVLIHYYVGGGWDPATCGSISPGRWQHVAVTFDRTNTTFYVNGTKVGQATDPAPASTDPIISIGYTPDDYTSPISSGNYGYLGRMDEVAVYEQALPASRIAAHYAAAIGTTNPTTWAATAAMNTARSEGSSAMLPDGRVLINGGSNGSTINQSTEVYSPASGAWTTTGTANVARFDTTADFTLPVLPDGRVLMAGGYGASSSLSLASAETFDPQAGTWTTVGAMSQARASYAWTILPDGRVMVAGGSLNSGGSAATATTEIFNPKTNQWAAGPAMSAARYNPAFATLPDGRFLVVGGANGTTFLSSAEIYNPQTNAWTSAGSLAAPRAYIGNAASVLDTGRVVVGHGGASSGVATDNTDIYDPATNTWSAGSTSTMAAWQGSQILLPSGRALWIGGLAGSTPTPATETRDETTGNWERSTSLKTARRLAAVHLLGDGKVLAAGGITAGGSRLASAELLPGSPGQAPANETAPTLTGTPAVGSTLRVLGMGWRRALSFTYRWERCDGDGTGCSTIPSATWGTYDVTAADAGKRLRVIATARNQFGTTAATSTTVGPVTP